MANAPLTTGRNDSDLSEFTAAQNKKKIWRRMKDLLPIQSPAADGEVRRVSREGRRDLRARWCFGSRSSGSRFTSNVSHSHLTMTQALRAETRGIVLPGASV